MTLKTCFKPMYMTNQGGTTVSIIDTTTNTVIDTITVGSNPIGIEYNPIKHRMYVANSNFGGSGTVSVINLCDCPPFDEESDGNGSIKSMLQAQASLLHENSLTTNAKPEAGISAFSEKTFPSPFSPPSISATGDSSELTATEKITKLKQQWLELLP